MLTYNTQLQKLLYRYLSSSQQIPENLRKQNRLNGAWGQIVQKRINLKVN